MKCLMVLEVTMRVQASQKKSPEGSYRRGTRQRVGIFTSAIRRDVDKKMKKKEDDADEY